MLHLLGKVGTRIFCGPIRRDYTLIDMAGIQPGMRVLDLACGAGSQTIQTAKRVGPSGSIVASDISATMLESVRQSAAAAGAKH